MVRARNISFSKPNSRSKSKKYPLVFKIEHNGLEVGRIRLPYTNSNRRTPFGLSSKDFHTKFIREIRIPEVMFQFDRRLISSSKTNDKEFEGPLTLTGFKSLTIGKAIPSNDDTRKYILSAVIKNTAVPTIISMYNLYLKVPLRKLGYAFEILPHSSQEGKKFDIEIPNEGPSYHPLDISIILVYPSKNIPTPSDDSTEEDENELGSEVSSEDENELGSEYGLKRPV